MSKLDRFLHAQEGVYENALQEIKTGKKTGHWMWFVFPQVGGLGYSEMSRYYAISGRIEAAAYLKHDVLGARLIEISEELLKATTSNAAEIFGSVDSLKLRSSMTLFSEVEHADPVFQNVLDKFFEGRKDGKTVSLLNSGSAG